MYSHFSRFSRSSGNPDHPHRYALVNLGQIHVQLKSLFLSRNSRSWQPGMDDNEHHAHNEQHKSTGSELNSIV